MSAVHEQIVEQAFLALPPEPRETLQPNLEDLLRSCAYPDRFPGKATSEEDGARSDPEAARFLYPEPPDEPWYGRAVELTAREAATGEAPLRWAHTCEHYLRASMEALSCGDGAAAARFMGVYSHVIADLAEPIHAVCPEIVDLVVPPPLECIGLELHANVEGLRAEVDIAGYEPRLLGRTVAQAAMGAYAGLCSAKNVGASVIVPIVQALYAGDRDRAAALSSRAQNASARAFADFMRTVLWLHEHGERPEGAELDLCEYPVAAAEVDMLYRYRPRVDVSLVPYSGGRTKPLALPDGDGGVERVRGLGVVPLLGPPFTPDRIRRATVEYWLVPKAFSVFRARAGINPLFEGSAGGAVFTVLGDQKELFRSPPLRAGDRSVEIDVLLGDARWLTLAMRYAPNPTPQEMAQTKEPCGWVLHGVWQRPRLES